MALHFFVDCTEPIPLGGFSEETITCTYPFVCGCDYCKNLPQWVHIEPPFNRWRVRHCKTNVFNTAYIEYYHDGDWHLADWLHTNSKSWHEIWSLIRVCIKARRALLLLGTKAPWVNW